MRGSKAPTLHKLAAILLYSRPYMDSVVHSVVQKISPDGNISSCAQVQFWVETVERGRQRRFPISGSWNWSPEFDQRNRGVRGYPPRFEDSDHSFSDMDGDHWIEVAPRNTQESRQTVVRILTAVHRRIYSGKDNIGRGIAVSRYWRYPIWWWFQFQARDHRSFRRNRTVDIGVTFVSLDPLSRDLSGVIMVVACNGQMNLRQIILFGERFGWKI